MALPLQPKTKKMKMNHVLSALLVLFACQLTAQNFYFGADLSYVNEMEDCGVEYQENGQNKDPYAIFADHGANLVRLRLWHTPAWYDTLNGGNRYSDLADVKRSIARAKEADMDVLLDFHFSDFWVDPGRQIVPAAWAAVVDDLPVLQDSLYNYVRATLLELHAENLLPELIQIGNETNKGIMQSEAADAAGWVLDWPRNAALFNRAIEAVRSVETETEANFQVCLHIAGPENAAWLMAGFEEYGVVDYDVIGLSYYWAWHQPTTIQRTGDIISELQNNYPGKEVMIFETGYIWTTESNDNANNIISSVQEGYAPASPENQKRWLIDLTQEVMNRGGKGVIYWEPAWVSSGCSTPWGQGSHQEHATFFDFESNLLVGGGMDFYSHPYNGTVGVRSNPPAEAFRAYIRPDQRAVVIERQVTWSAERPRATILTMEGKEITTKMLNAGATPIETIELPELPAAIYVVNVTDGDRLLGSKLVILNKN